MTDPTTRDPAAILARCIELAAKSPERWKVDDDEHGTEIVTDVCSEVYRGHVASCVDADDAATIAAAVNFLRDAAPALLAEVARYRWLRAHWHDLLTATGPAVNGKVQVVEIFTHGEHAPIDPESLDAAIDAAILAHHGARTGESNG